MSNNPFDQAPQQPFPYVFQQAPVPQQHVPYYPASANVNDGAHHNHVTAPMPHQYATPSLMPLQQPVPTGFPAASPAPMFYAAQQQPQYAAPQSYDNAPFVQQPHQSAYGAPPAAAVTVEHIVEQVPASQQQQARITPAQPVSFVRVVLILAAAACFFAVFTIAIPLIFVNRDNTYNPTPSPSTNCYYNPKGNRETVMSIYDSDKISNIEIHGVAQVEVREAYGGSVITVNMRAASLELNDYSAIQFKTSKLNGTAVINSVLNRQPRDCTWASVTITIPPKFVLAPNFSLKIVVDKNANVTSYSRSVRIAGPYNGRFNFSSINIEATSVDIEQVNVENVNIASGTYVRFYISNITNLVALVNETLSLSYVNATNVSANCSRLDITGAFSKNATYNVTNYASLSFTTYTSLYEGQVDFVLKGELGQYQTNFTRVTLPTNHPLTIKETSLKRYTAVIGNPTTTTNMNSITVTMTGTNNPNVYFTMTKYNNRKRVNYVK